MSVGSLDPGAIFQRALEYATANLRIERLLIQVGLDPNHVTYEAIFNRLLDLALAGITFANVMAVIGGIFLVMSFVARTIVPMRVLCIVSIVFLLGSALLAGSVQHFLMYFLALPVNVVRLVQIRNMVKKARSSAQGTLSLDWLRPYMTPRNYSKGDVLFRKGDAATEMFLTASGKFLVTEINIEIPAGRILGELGFLSPNNHRTQSVECIEDGEVLTIGYERLHEIYLENPEFGYFFLRLTSDRLLQNHARLAGLVEQTKAELAAASGGDGAGPDAKRGFKAFFFKGAAATSSSSSASAAVDNALARRRRRALAIVERHANYSGVGGFIPLPIVNIAAIAAILVRMVRALSELYGPRIERKRAYALVIGLMGGVMPERLATVATSSIVYFVPGANFVGLAVSSVTASAYARAIGRMLIDHFEREAALERERFKHRRGRRWPIIWRLRPAAGDDAWFPQALNLDIRRWLRRGADSQ